MKKYKRNKRPRVKFWGWVSSLHPYGEWDGIAYICFKRPEEIVIDDQHYHLIEVGRADRCIGRAINHEHVDDFYGAIDCSFSSSTINAGQHLTSEEVAEIKYWKPDWEKRYREMIRRGGESV